MPGHSGVASTFFQERSRARNKLAQPYSGEAPTGVFSGGRCRKVIDA
jgi:hypothetical protein